MATKILAILCALLATIAAYLAYHVIDVSVSLSDARAQSQFMMKEVNALRDFAFDLAKGKTRDEIRRQLFSKFGNDYLVKDDPNGTIYLQDIAFKFRNDQLVAIEATTDPPRPGDPK